MFMFESFNMVQVRKLFCGVICLASLVEKSDDQLDCKDFCWPFMFFGWPITNNIVPDELLPETDSMPNETTTEMADADVAPKLQVQVGKAEDFPTDSHKWWYTNSLCGNLYQKNVSNTSHVPLDLGMSNGKNIGEPQDVFVSVVKGLKFLKFYGRFRNIGVSPFQDESTPTASAVPLNEVDGPEVDRSWIYYPPRKDEDRGDGRVLLNQPEVWDPFGEQIRTHYIHRPIPSYSVITPTIECRSYVVPIIKCHDIVLCQ